jgi:hypothetical protein
MADAAAVPVPVPAEAAPAPTMGELFADYNPEGAMNGLFAPAYVHGYAPSQKAVADWQAQHHAVTPAMLEETRMPGEWHNPEDLQAAGPSYGKGMKVSSQGYDQYGSGRIPNYLDLIGGKGTVDPDALRIMAQGGRYDIDARRAAIAQRLSSNAAQQTAYDASKAAQVNPYNPWANFPKDLAFDL